MNYCIEMKYITAKILQISLYSNVKLSDAYFVLILLNIFLYYISKRDKYETKEHYT